LAELATKFLEALQKDQIKTPNILFVSA